MTVSIWYILWGKSNSFLQFMPLAFLRIADAQRFVQDADRTGPISCRAWHCTGFRTKKPYFCPWPCNWCKSLDQFMSILWTYVHISAAFLCSMRPELEEIRGNMLRLAEANWLHSKLRYMQTHIVLHSSLTDMLHTCCAYWNKVRFRSLHGLH